MGFKPTSGAHELCMMFKDAREASKKSYLNLFSESIKARFGETGIGFSEFFGYRLYDPNVVDLKDIPTFMSSAVSKQIWEKMNPPKWWGIPSDKITFQLLLEKMGFDQPELLAIYAKDGRQIPGKLCLKSAEEITSFLRQSDSYPIFAKPNDSYRSLGSLGIRKYDASSKSFELMNGNIESASTLTQSFLNWDTYVFQESLLPDPSLMSFCGTALSTMRVVALYTQGNPKIFRVVWKIPCKENMADNFWRPGNLVAHVEPETGKVISLIQSTDTGHITLSEADERSLQFYNDGPPMFKEAIELAKELTYSFSMFRYQAWDIALTERGPVAIELNPNGDIELLQIGAPRGILDNDFRKVLLEYNISIKNPKLSLRDDGYYSKNN